MPDPPRSYTSFMGVEEVPRTDEQKLLVRSDKRNPFWRSEAGRICQWHAPRRFFMRAPEIFIVIVEELLDFCG